MPEFVELTPEQATLLLSARYAEHSRVRHEAEEWFSQAGRDIQARDKQSEQVTLMGVPPEQVRRFVYDNDE